MAKAVYSVFHEDGCNSISTTPLTHLIEMYSIHIYVCVSQILNERRRSFWKLGENSNSMANCHSASANAIESVGSLVVLVDGMEELIGLRGDKESANKIQNEIELKFSVLIPDNHCCAV